MNFKAKVTEAGKDNYKQVKLQNPKKRNLTLVRCLGSEEVICVG